MVMHRLIRGLYHHPVTLEHWIILGLLMLLGVAWLRLRPGPDGVRDGR